VSKIGIGLVGAGWMGTALLRRLGERDDVELAWVVSRNPDRARGLLGELGLSRARVSADYERMLSDAQVQAVFLASPNSFHGQQAIAAMQAGKHVFCEKPAATRFDEFAREIELERANPGLITYVDYILYFDSLERRLRTMVADGALGRITQIQVNYRHPINIAGEKKWKLSRAIMGDAIGMGINHALSVMILAMASQARPVGVFATALPAQVRAFQAECIWNILVRFDNGAAGFCFGNIDSCNGYDAYHSISGTRGEFIFDSRLDRPQKVRMWSESLTAGQWVYPLDDQRCRQQGVQPWPADTTTPDSGDVFEHQTGAAVGHFIECVKTGARSPLSFVNSATIAEVGWAARMSAATGAEVRLPLDYAAASGFFSRADTQVQ